MRDRGTEKKFTRTTNTHLRGRTRNTLQLSLSIATPGKKILEENRGYEGKEVEPSPYPKIPGKRGQFGHP